MIFCVEDDSSIRDLVCYTLKASGFEAVGFENGNVFLDILRKNRPELILLDIMLPDIDGITLLKRLRQNPATADIPVIMTTAKGTEYDKIFGLELGADDYLAKPFSMLELVSRIKAVLRRSKPDGAAKHLRIGGLELNQASHMVSIHGEALELTLKEYELLQLFLKNPGKVFTRENLLSFVWGSDFIGESRTVDVHIATLRTKLSDYGGYIKTVRGVGYKLEGHVGDHV